MTYKTLKEEREERELWKRRAAAGGFMSPEAKEELGKLFKRGDTVSVHSGSVRILRREEDRQWEASGPRAFSFHPNKKECIKRAIIYVDECLDEIVEMILESGIPPDEVVHRIQETMVRKVMEA